MKRLFYSTVILVMLCGCKGSGKAMSEVTGGLARGLAESLGKSGADAIGKSFSQQDYPC